MILCIKRDISSETSRFAVYGEDAQLRYTVSGKHTASGQRLTVFDTSGKKLLAVRALSPLNMLYAFMVTDYHENFRLAVASVSKGIEVRFYGISWRLEGSIPERQFMIVDADNSAVACQRISHSGKYAYQLDIKKPKRELFALAVALCTDLISFSADAEAVRV